MYLTVIIFLYRESEPSVRLLVCGPLYVHCGVRGTGLLRLVQESVLSHPQIQGKGKSLLMTAVVVFWIIELHHLLIRLNTCTWKCCFENKNIRFIFKNGMHRFIVWTDLKSLHVTYKYLYTCTCRNLHVCSLSESHLSRVYKHCMNKLSFWLFFDCQACVCAALNWKIS